MKMKRGGYSHPIANYPVPPTNSPQSPPELCMSTSFSTFSFFINIACQWILIVNGGDCLFWDFYWGGGRF